MKRLLPVLALLSCGCGSVDPFVSFDQKDGVSNGGRSDSGGSSSNGSGGSVSEDSDSGVEACKTGEVRCSAAQPQTCVSGIWVGNGAACSERTPLCRAGVCVDCEPGTMQCGAGEQPILCVNGAWAANGPGCSGHCLNGLCVECRPGDERCIDGTGISQQAQTCNDSGAWQNIPSYTHNNGIGQSWQDCEPPGTYNIDQAKKACGASGAIACTDVLCIGGQSYAICAQGGEYCWGYRGPSAGYVSSKALGGSGCPVPGSGTRPWS